ncbi:MAG TPA: SDR family NAD(P)-dependent oxidoreductase [Caulobacterales bacterium]|jgi:NAD(P)-dependent dehydrogenase (short-subunit alcohol dehydrogenase family)|nr:SDR family NAD(P)-dependent oxidoreductase [Caulobacterales bacterium]
MTDRLKSKTCIVVGAGQTPGETIGNGRAIAMRFAREGAEILCVDKDLARAEETARMIVADGGKAAAFRGDVTKAEDCAAIVEAGRERWPRIDILVDNVGVGGRDAPAHLLEESTWDRTMNVNLKGTWQMIKAVLPAMREAGGGAIVNISSLASTSGATQLAYEISKAGVNRLTQHVAASNTRYNIRCNAILMGFMDTPMAMGGPRPNETEEQKNARAERRAQRDARVPLGGKMGTAWDTANAALFLASDEAKFITGVLLTVDGGMSVRGG